MTIKTWEQRRQELIDKGADAGYIGPMHAEISELRNALQDYDAGGMAMTQAYKKLRDEAESLREKVWLTAQERDEAREELAAIKQQEIVAWREFDGEGNYLYYDIAILKAMKTAKQNGMSVTKTVRNISKGGLSHSAPHQDRSHE